MQSAPALAANPLAGRHVMLVVAHPDDETLSAGAALSEASRITLVHVTDGAESLYKAWRKGFRNRKAYADARRKELHRALRDIESRIEFIPLGFRDRRAVYHMGEIANALLPILRDHRPDIVLTHAFEGGHPDHDATAMATHLAWRALDVQPALYEFPSYNRAPGKFVFASFIPQSGAEEIVLTLPPDLQEKKREWLAAFTSQDDVVPHFSLATEIFRRAPGYDFTRKPHAGLLHYEHRCLPVSWQSWLEEVRRAEWHLDHGVPAASGMNRLLRLSSRLQNVLLRIADRLGRSPAARQ